jgi:hypothetical protein
MAGSGLELVNTHDLVDRLSLVKDPGTISRFREASRIVDVGHRAVFEALRNGGWMGLTETEIAGLAALAMRRAGSEWEWSFTGGNEIASGYRTGRSGMPEMEKSISRCPDQSNSQPDEPDRTDKHAPDARGQINEKSDMKNRSDKDQLINEGSEQPKCGQPFGYQAGFEQGEIHRPQPKTHEAEAKQPFRVQARQADCGYGGLNNRIERWPFPGQTEGAILHDDKINGHDAEADQGEYFCQTEP